MGSIATIKVFGDDRTALLRATTKVMEEFQRLENLLTIFRTSSQVSRVNGHAGRSAVSVEREVREILSFSIAVSQQTQGAFDITVGSLMNLWGFHGTAIGGKPADRDIRAVLESVGPDKILVDDKEGTVGLSHPVTRIDLGGVGVGYAIDRAIGILKAGGVESAFLNHSGDAYALGVPDEQEGWEIGIPDPAEPGVLRERMVLRDEAIATSGGYNQFVTLESRRFPHIIDPRSGVPGKAELSVSVRAPKAITADALSTSLYCMTSDQRRRTVDVFPQTSFIVLEGR